jgi:hypothetical protein
MRSLAAIVFASFVSAALLPLSLEAQTLIPSGAAWRYLDNGSDQGNAWQDPLFDDSSWAQGPAELGYGDAPVTTVSFGGDASNKYITTYFRHTFTLASLAGINGLTLGLQRDDGAVVYLNGAELIRDNMPVGPISFQTLASATVSGANENAFFPFHTGNAGLVAGDNVIAVEVHQRATNSSDISFALTLAVADFSIVRGPYLQLSTASSQVVRWRTDAIGIGKVRYGLVANNLDMQSTEVTAQSNHVVTLEGLAADTTYFYEVLTNDVVVSGSGVFSFKTPPALDDIGPHRIWVLGDSGTKDANQESVRNGFRSFASDVIPDLWLMLGDNAYETGTDAEYQAAVFDMYARELRSSTLWPTLGNHDAGSASSSTQTGVYYDIFSLPKAAEAGGHASTTEAYYSFDYGNIHFICLDSHDSSRVIDGAMANWLRDDLDANQRKWTIAFFHHPPYSKGSHDSDNAIETRSIQMRENFLPILEDGGVDLVLTGHSHSYERSFLLAGHYGLSTTLTPAMKLDDGSGNPDTDHAYEKVVGGSEPPAGTVYAVAGSSGKTSNASLDHPAMYTSQLTLGSMVLDVSADQLAARFVKADGTFSDLFVITKAEPIEFTLGGDVNGLVGTGMVLQNNGGDDLVITGNGSFSFSTPLSSGTDYSVSILLPPVTPVQNCQVSEGDGVIAGFDISSVSVFCDPPVELLFDDGFEQN